MSSFSTDTNGIQRLITPPTGDAGTAVDGNFGALSALITTLNAAITTANSLIAALQSGKSAKATSPTAGHLASVDGGGNVLDSGYTAGNFDAAGTAAAVNSSLGTHAAATAAHGAAGAVVGTTNAQTLTNKTLSGATNTFSNIPAGALPAMVASGSGHAAGIVPDPPASAGTAKFLREDATWVVPAGSSARGTAGQMLYSNGSGVFVADVSTTDGSGNFRNVASIQVAGIGEFGTLYLSAGDTTTGAISWKGNSGGPPGLCFNWAPDNTSPGNPTTAAAYVTFNFAGTNYQIALLQ